jgi:hypothetical protein
VILSLALAVPPVLPPDAVEYVPAKYTQAIYRLNDVPRIDLVFVTRTDPKWHRSGGMTADMNFTSRKYRSGGRAVYSLGGISVKNSLGFFQTERGLLRVYPAGARFDDVLYNDVGVVFEHRTRVKDADGKWRSKIIYRDEDANPKGYSGLGESCAGCHSQAGSGGYGVGLVPGGDGVISDPMDWSAIDPAWKDVEK